MNPECIFCKIADGREPAHIVFEDEISVAFLDMRPVYHGHTLLIPKLHDRRNMLHWSRRHGDY